MSRSYKLPIYKDGYKSKWKQIEKQCANSVIRKNWNIASGSAYKKYYDSWNICDYIIDYRFSKDDKWKMKAARK